MAAGTNSGKKPRRERLILTHISDHLRPALTHVRERADLEAPGFTPGSLICSASVAFRPPLTEFRNTLPSLKPLLSDGCGDQSAA